MLHARVRRKSSLKGIPAVKEPPGPIIKFQWSISAAHLSLLNDNSSIIFPSVATNRFKRKFLADSPSLIEQNSECLSSTYTQKSSSSINSTKKYQSSMSIKQNKNSTRNSPLLLTYAQLHQISFPPPAKRLAKARLSIYPILNDKRNSISLVNNKIILTPGPSISSTTTKSLLTTKTEHLLSHDTLVRLNTPDLRQLNVSEKYINEAKKLYFNATCKSFIPRV